MTHHATPSPGDTSLSRTIEGNGFVLSCSACGWTRYDATRGASDREHARHAKTCKPKVAPAERAATGPRAVAWDDREGATWIDQL